MSTKHNLLVKIVAGYVIGSFIVMEILWFVWCRPFHDYWAVPPSDLNCSAETNHMITSAIFNISSDIMIIMLPMPVLFQSQLPLKRKLTLAGVFALGSFTILAAALSKYYSLHIPYGTEWIYWYIREVSTAIITANLPLTWTLLQRIFGISNFLSRHSKSSEAQTPGRHTAYGNLSSRTRETKKPDPYVIDISPSESQEQINGEYGVQLKIWQNHEISVTTEEVHAKDSRGSSENGDIAKGSVEMGVSTKVSRDL